MKLTTTYVDVWSTEIDDEAGGLARTLPAIAEFGADLDHVMAYRDSEKPGKGVLFVSSVAQYIPLDRVTDIGLRRRDDRPALKIEGNDEPGVGAKLARAVAEAGVSMKSLSAGVIGNRFACYIEFDNVQDREKADAAIKALNAHFAWHLFAAAH